MRERFARKLTLECHNNSVHNTDADDEHKGTKGDFDDDDIESEDDGMETDDDIESEDDDRLETEDNDESEVDDSNSFDSEDDMKKYSEMYITAMNDVYSSI